MAKRHQPHLMFEHFSIIFDAITDEQKAELFFYAVAVIEAPLKELTEKMKEMETKRSGTILEQLKQIGREEAKEKAYTAHKKDRIKSIQRLVKEGVPITVVANALQVEEDFVIAVVQGNEPDDSKLQARFFGDDAELE